MEAPPFSPRIDEDFDFVGLADSDCGSDDKADDKGGGDTSSGTGVTANVGADGKRELCNWEDSGSGSIARSAVLLADFFSCGEDGNVVVPIEAERLAVVVVAVAEDLESYRARSRFTESTRMAISACSMRFLSTFWARASPAAIDTVRSFRSFSNSCWSNAIEKVVGYAEGEIRRMAILRYGEKA